MILQLFRNTVNLEETEIIPKDFNLQNIKLPNELNKMKYNIGPLKHSAYGFQMTHKKVSV